MKKLSKINESVFKNIVKRSDEKEKRIENKSRFDEPFNKIKNGNVYKVGNTIWTEFNFGSDSAYKPGWYMSKEDIEELNEYLKGTGYRVADRTDFANIYRYISIKAKSENGYWIFNVNDELKIPNFGYVSGYYVRKNLPEEVTKPTKRDAIIYGTQDLSYVLLYVFDNSKRFGVLAYDKVQVRLVKEHTHNWKGVNESVFGKVVKRSNGVEERTEDSAPLQNRLNDFVSRHDRDANLFYIENKKVCCNCNVDIWNDDLIDGEFPFQFGNVEGDFDCTNCFTLTSLKGSPQEVSGDFICSWCDKLTSLEGSPQKVGKDFACSNCKNLTSLEGAPQEVGEDFYCSHCDNLTSLDGISKEIGKNLFCKKRGTKFKKSDIPEGTILKGKFNNR